MPVKKRALGRGLDSLLGSQVAPPEPALSDSLAIRVLPVAQLRPNPYQPRRQFNADGLEELAASIEQSGILQPLVVRKRAEGYEIVAGERRWRAAQRLGLAEVPAIIRDYSDQEMLELALIENLQREELNPVEEARAYQQLIQIFELTQEQVAERVGKSRVAVTNALRLLRLPEQILKWVEEGALSAGHAKTLLPLEREALQIALCREIMAKGLSVRETEQRVRRIVKSPDPEVKAQNPSVAIETRDLEEKLSVHVGLQVKICPKTNTTGKIEVYYSSLDDFQRFFDHLGISLKEEM